MYIHSHPVGMLHEEHKQNDRTRKSGRPFRTRQELRFDPSLYLSFDPSLYLDRIFYSENEMNTHAMAKTANIEPNVYTFLKKLRPNPK